MTTPNIAPKQNHAEALGQHIGFSILKHCKRGRKLSDGDFDDALTNYFNNLKLRPHGTARKGSDCWPGQ